MSKDEEFEDDIAEDPDEALDDDEMSPAEAAFSRGAEAEEEDEKGVKEEEEEVPEGDEVR